MLVAELIALKDRRLMAYGKHPKAGEGIPGSVKKAEGAALHRLWKRHAKRSQAEFLATLELSGGYLPQFFSGKRPITLELAHALSAELRVDIADFSTRLAAELELKLQASEWPFLEFSRVDYKHLTVEQRSSIEQIVLGFLRANGHIPTKRIRRVG